MSTYFKAFSEGFISSLCRFLFVSLYELIYDTYRANNTTTNLVTDSSQNTVHKLFITVVERLLIVAF